MQDRKEQFCKCNIGVNLKLVFNPLTPMNDQERISPYKISPYNFKQKRDENKEKYQLGDYYLIRYQILRTNTTRIVW